MMKLFFVLLVILFLVATSQNDEIEEGFEIDLAAADKSGEYFPLKEIEILDPLALTGVLFNKSFNMPKSLPPYGECPRDLQLAVYAEDESLKIDLPSGLNSKQGCNVTEWTYSETFEKRTKGRYRGYRTKINKDALRCGDYRYRRIHLSTLLAIFEPLLKDALAQLAIPEFIINAALNDPKGEGPPDYWNTDDIARIIGGARLEIEKLDTFHTLELGFVSVPGMNHSCVFLRGGTPNATEAKEVIQNWVPFVARLAAHADKNNVEGKPVSKFYAASDCPSGIKSFQFQSIPLKLLEEVESKELKDENLVSINCELCSDTAKLHTVSEAEMSKADEIGEEALELGRNLVEFQENRTRNSNVTNNSKLWEEYPTVAAKIMTTLGKSSVYIAQVTCDNVLQESPIYVAIVRKPAKFFLCGRSFFSRMSGMACDNVRATSDITAFIVRDGSKCILSSDDVAASEIRSYGYESSPEPTPESTPESIPESTADADLAAVHSLTS